MDDKKHWTNFYKARAGIKEPSSFAKFVLEYLDENKSLIDLGCGNGRDTIFFSKNNIDALGIDQVQCEIEYLSKKYEELNLNFRTDDFTNLKAVEEHYDYVYSRFTFHSITEDGEDRTLNWIENNIKKNGLFLVEARSIKDPMFNKGRKLSDNENCTDHYRRYLNFDDFIEKIENHGFSIIYKIESDGLAIYKDDDPVVIRVIAKKT